VTTWGNCLTPKPNVNGAYRTGQFSQCQCCASSTQCAAAYKRKEPFQPIKNDDSCQFATCNQKYAFPYYYYDKFIGRVLYKTKEHAPESVAPADLETTAMSGAKKICDQVSADMSAYSYKTGDRLASAAQMAWIWLTANKEQANAVRDCPAALVIAFGECQDELQDNQLKCWAATNDPWQTGGTSSAAGSAQGAYTGGSQNRCAGAPAVVPIGGISAGNANYLPYFAKDGSLKAGTTFCHHNQWSGAGFGGGMCAGGTGTARKE